MNWNSDPCSLLCDFNSVLPCGQPSHSRFILLVDFSNAFNSVDRSALFCEVRLHTPSISAWMECCYGAQPILHLSDHTILSSCGVQQGDPLGPLGFALALQPIVDRIKREVPGLLVNAWFLDAHLMSRSVHHRI